MSTPTRRLVCIVRVLAVVCLALTLATPAAAQFGGLKKKAQQAAGAEAAKTVGDTTAAQHGAAPAPARRGRRGDGGRGARRPDRRPVHRRAQGRKGRARDGEKGGHALRRYNRDAAAYEAAKDKCAEAQANFPNRAAADPKFADRYSATADKMVKAQEAGNQELAAAVGRLGPGNDGPELPDQTAEAARRLLRRPARHRQPRGGAGDQDLEDESERVRHGPGADLDDPAGPDPARRRVGQREVGGEQPVRRAQAADGPAGAAPGPCRQAGPRAGAAARPPAAPAPTGMSDDQTKLANCMAKNAKKHEKEIEALGQAGPGRGDRPTTWRRPWPSPTPSGSSSPPGASRHDAIRADGAGGRLGRAPGGCDGIARRRLRLGRRPRGAHLVRMGDLVAARRRPGAAGLGTRRSPSGCGGADQARHRMGRAAAPRRE